MKKEVVKPILVNITSNDHNSPLKLDANYVEATIYSLAQDSIESHYDDGTRYEADMLDISKGITTFLKEYGAYTDLDYNDIKTFEALMERYTMKGENIDSELNKSDYHVYTMWEVYSRILKEVPNNQYLQQEVALLVATLYTVIDTWRALPRTPDVLTNGDPNVVGIVLDFELLRRISEEIDDLGDNKGLNWLLNRLATDIMVYFTMEVMFDLVDVCIREDVREAYLHDSVNINQLADAMFLVNYLNNDNK